MSAVAPQAPGRLGQPVDVGLTMTYLQLLGQWVQERRRELDALDAALLAAPQQAGSTDDMLLSMSVWQAVKNRYELLLATWDSGRVGAVEQQKLSNLIWGHLDEGALELAPAGGGVSGLNVSLPEACRLSDALAGQLRSTLRLSPSSDQASARLRELRAQLERLRDQITLEPPATRAQLSAKVEDLAARTADIADKAERGGDVGGLLGPLEIQAATFERDLIVEGQKRRDARGKLDSARALRASLEAREDGLQDLVQRTLTTVAPAPKYAVPAVAAIGPVPSSASQLDSYLSRLTQVASAMDVVQRAYTAALDDHTQLVGQLDALRAKAAATGLGVDPDIAGIAALAETFLQRSPTPIDVARRLVDSYAQALRTYVGATR